MDFLGQFVNFLGWGGKYINFRAKIKILFVNVQTSIFFSKSWGERGAHNPPLPLSSSIIGEGGPTFWHL